MLELSKLKTRLPCISNYNLILLSRWIVDNSPIIIGMWEESGYKIPEEKVLELLKLATPLKGVRS